MSQPTPQPNKKSRKPADTPKRNANPTMAVDGEEDEDGGHRFLFFNVMPSWMVSFICHIAVIVALAIIIMPDKEEKKVALEASEHAAEPLDMIDLNLDAMEFETEDPFETEFTEDTPTEMTEELEVQLQEAEFDIGTIMGAEDTSFEMDTIGEISMSDASNETGSRSSDSRKEMLKKYGGTPASEESVALALKWIVDHQLPDGGWNFDHQRGPGTHRTSSNPGHMTEARAGATALALLPLLGNGQTHRTGTYKKEVQAGLEYLMKRAKRSRRGISYLEPGGSMYSHGLVSIVFCEAYAMTKDPMLAPFAQGTVWFIEDAQDPIGGGWRYRPGEPGDTSAVGWQLMALKSGKITGLDINPRTYKRAEKFLDSVSNSNGAFYGYMTPPGDRGNASGRTAVGLLCRMYMGWTKDSPGMVDGVNALAARGPDLGDMYHGYYATQVMKHIGGRTWNDWNVKMRDSLVKSQVKEGPGAGSWTPTGKGHSTEKAGRLYQTSMSCMTLEVYYRYLPLYGDSAANDEFKLD